jgi:hypothetical protein
MNEETARTMVVPYTHKSCLQHSNGFLEEYAISDQLDANMMMYSTNSVLESKHYTGISSIPAEIRWGNLGFERELVT